MLLRKFLATFIMYLIGYSSGLVLNFDVFLFSFRKLHFKWLLLQNFLFCNFSRYLFLIVSFFPSLLPFGTREVSYLP